MAVMERGVQGDASPLLMSMVANSPRSAPPSLGLAATEVEPQNVSGRARKPCPEARRLWHTGQSLPPRSLRRGTASSSAAQIAQVERQPQGRVIMVRGRDMQMTHVGSS